MVLRENSPNLATEEGRKARKNGAGRTGDWRRWPAQRDPGNRVLSAKEKRCPVGRSRGILVRCANRTRFLPTRPSVRSIHRRKPAEGMKDKTARSGRSSDRSDSKGRSSRKVRQVGGVQRPGVIERPCRLALRRKSKRRPEGKSPACIDGAPRERRHKRRREPRSKPAKTKRGYGREAVQTRLALYRPSGISRRKPRDETWWPRDRGSNIRAARVAREHRGPVTHLKEWGQERAASGGGPARNQAAGCSRRSTRLFCGDTE